MSDGDVVGLDEKDEKKDEKKEKAKLFVLPLSPYHRHYGILVHY